MNKIIFAPLVKRAVADDGTLQIEGIASTEAVDAAGEIVKADAIRGAIADYLKLGGSGALREMHQPLAAGKVTSIKVDDKGVTRVSAVVVDQGTIRKIRLGVLKGLSIGGTVLSRDKDNPKIITKLSLAEISCVDVPCNGDALLTSKAVKLWEAANTHRGPSPEEITAALKALPPEERALVYAKAALRFPRPITTRIWGAP